MSLSYTTPDSDHLGLNTEYLPSTLSPYPHSHTVSNSASPSYNLNSTPGESLSDYSNYQPSEYTELEDEYWGVNFDADFPGEASSLPPHQFDIGARQAPPLIHSQSDPSPLLGDQQFANLPQTRLPLTPIQSNTPSTPSPRTEANDHQVRKTISQHQLTTELQKAHSQHQLTLRPSQSTLLELTPDHSGSSHTSAEGLEPFPMAYPGKSPQVTVSDWQTGAFSLDAHHAIPGSQAATVRDDEGLWRNSEETGQAGLDPERRKLLEGIEVPTLKEQDNARLVNRKNAEVRDWVSTSQADPANSGTNPYTASEAGSIRHFNPADDNSHIKPVDDAASIRENAPRDGDIYYNLKSFRNNGFNSELSETDLSLIVGRQWNDAPTVPSMTKTQIQPQTANDAMRQYKDNADQFSVISRRATWGTRRLSEPSIADFDSITDGSFLKKMSITDSPEKSRQSIFDSLAKMVQKSSSNLKRAHSTSRDVQEPTVGDHPRVNSQGSLAPPPRNNSFGRKPAATPSINTAFAAMVGPLAAVGTTHARSGSISASGSGPASATSPKSPANLGGFARSVIKRARSRSDLARSTSNENVEPTGIANLWGRQGGPPVPNTAFQVTAATTALPTEPDQRPQENNVDLDEDEDDEDDEEFEGDHKIEPNQNSDPIVPNYDGFKAHVWRLNPEMDPQFSWLVSRIAHQQDIRYKTLLGSRVKHSQAVRKGSCSAGQHCEALGGKPTLYDVKGKVRELEPPTTGLHLVTDFDGNESGQGDTALGPESFPSGVPMPPTRSLPAEFECQLCFKSKKFHKPSDWTKHVHEDVQPFTCTYDKCKDAKSFKRKADWVRHENERHRHLEWWVCQYDDCRHPCYRKDNFLQHLVREHKLPEPKQKTKTAIKNARHKEPVWAMLEQCHHETTNKPQDEPCKFCGRHFNTWKKLTVHLAKHMENITLPVLKLIEERTVDADTIISPIEQNLTPITPMPKLEAGTSPFDFENLSPHPSNPQQFSTPYQPSLYYPSVEPTSQFAMQAQSHVPQGIPYNQASTFTNTHHFPMDHTQAFNPMDSSYSQQGVAGPIYSTSQPSQPRGHQYSMSQGYIPNTRPIATPASQQNMLGINTFNYGFDMPLNPAQGYTQVPIARVHGSTSPYGHSPSQSQFYGP
ncbi:C2H2 finger domain-containing protein [Phlyctema vagabunda]|uniref:C2H2 finger domain-containing protein n=1 Tax=Phlyctema vagabunda TaxID=108571 RepID=A0ABR4PNB4_9HELO